MKKFNKLFSIFTALALIWGQLLAPTLILAQEAASSSEQVVEVSPGPEPSPSPSETPALSPEPSPTPTSTLSLEENLTITPATESAIIDTSTTESQNSASLAPPLWQENPDGSATTTGPVTINQTYKAPQNDKVSITFTILPDSPGKLTIKEVTLTDEQMAETGALTKTAYDISSTMEDGSFEYTLTLPTPKTDNVEVKASEDGQSFVTLGGVSAQTDTLTITGLNHFTIFVVASPGGNTSDPSIGDIMWTLGDTRLSNDTYATVGLGAGNISHYLWTNNYGLSIPTDATILGIKVNVERKCSSSTDCVDHSIRLIKGGTVSGNEKADTVTNYPTTDTVKSYGGDTDLWGLAWTPADLNSADFGVAFAAENTVGASKTVSVDIIQVVIGYNRPPVAINRSVSTPEDVAIQINLIATDADVNDVLTYFVANPANGTLSGTSPFLTYTPNANFNGADSFTFRVNDGTVDSNTATVSIAVAAVNDAPVAVNDAISTTEDTLVNIAVLANDSDVDGNLDATTVTVTSGPSNGSTSVNNVTGNITYTPAGNFNGADSFVYRVCDTAGSCASATVNVTVNSVNDSPSFDAIANQNVNEDASEQNVPITNVSPGPESESGQTVTLSATSNNTSLVPNPTVSGSGANRTLAYTPVANANGTATITVTAQDSGGVANGGTATFSRTFTITVTPANDSPTITLNSPNGGEVFAGGTEDIGINWTAADIDGNTLTIEYLRYTTDNGASYTTIANNLPNSGAYPWTIPSINSATVKVEARVCDPAGACANDSSNNNFTIDSTAPTLSEVTPVPSPINPDINPLNYTFNSSEAGTITYNGSCASLTSDAVAGNNTITFDSLWDGDYNDCLIDVSDATGNQSNTLTVSPFTIDTTGPDTNELTPAISPFDFDNYYIKGIVGVAGYVTDSVGVASVNFNINDFDAGGDSEASCPGVRDPNNPNLWSCAIDTTTLPDSSGGDYDMRVTATDTAGNTTTDYFSSWNDYFGIDNTKPTNVTVVDSGPTTTNPHLTFTWPASQDDASGLSYYQFWLSTATNESNALDLDSNSANKWKNIGDVTSYTLTDTEAALLTAGGQYFAKVKGVDFMGNVANTNVSSWSDRITYDVGTIIIVKDTVPDDAQDFTFTRTFGANFSLDDDSDNTLPNTVTFANVPSGQYTVIENQVNGWGLTGITCQDSDNGSTTNLSTRTASIDLDPGNIITCTFTNTKLGSISGMKFEDLNGNGVKEASDSGRLGWTVRLSGEASASATTTTNGSYTFSNLLPGTYQVCEAPDNAWSQKKPASGYDCGDGLKGYTVNLSAGQEVSGIDFGNFKKVIIDIFKWKDLDADGVLDEGELPLGGWNMRIEEAIKTLTSTPNPVEGQPPVMTEEIIYGGLRILPTNDDGHALPEVDKPGTYRVTEESQDNFQRTHPLVDSFFDIFVEFSGQTSGDGQTFITKDKNGNPLKFGNAPFQQVGGSGTKFVPTSGDSSLTISLVVIDPAPICPGGACVMVEGQPVGSNVVLQNGTVITRSDGEMIDISQLGAQAPNIGDLKGFDTNMVIDGALQWGIPNFGLEFDKPITLNIFVGTSFNGQTLNVVRSTTGTSGWTSEGIRSVIDDPNSPAICTVVSGICKFYATKASYYATTHTKSTTTSSSTSGGDGGDGLGCAVHDCSGVHPAPQNPVLALSTPGGRVVLNPAEGFAPGILGTTTDQENVVVGQDQGQIQGETTATQPAAEESEEKLAGPPVNVKVIVLIAIALLLGFGAFKLLFK